MKRKEKERFYEVICKIGKDLFLTKSEWKWMKYHFPAENFNMKEVKKLLEIQLGLKKSKKHFVNVKIKD